MAHREIRQLRQDDFAALMSIEEEVFGAAGEGVLGAYYVRLCCEFFPDSCFAALEGGRIVGYVLCFLKGREAYCTTLAVAPGRQGSRVALQLLKALDMGPVIAVDPSPEKRRIAEQIGVELEAAKTCMTSDGKTC